LVAGAEVGDAVGCAPAGCSAGGLSALSRSVFASLPPAIVERAFWAFFAAFTCRFVG
jgi:MFS-type transporter involved in bile tolerance (Atg22 family)